MTTSTRCDTCRCHATAFLSLFSSQDVASKFFEHFISIADAINSIGGSGLWDDGDGFYYDQLRSEVTVFPFYQSPSFIGFFFCTCGSLFFLEH